MCACLFVAYVVGVNQSTHAVILFLCVCVCVCVFSVTLAADPDSRHLDAVLREVYVLYSDYVLKNPFYESDMPIQCERFDERVQRLAADYNRR